MSSDTDLKPYCDWLQDGGWNFTTTSCEDIDGIFCDADGYVAEVFINEKGLRCAFPAALGQMTRLEVRRI